MEKIIIVYRKGMVSSMANLVAFINAFLSYFLLFGFIVVLCIIAVFAGIKLFGIAGIIKGPLALVITCEVCKYLWKKES